MIIEERAMNTDFTYCHGTWRCQQCDGCKRYVPFANDIALWQVEPKLNDKFECENYIKIKEIHPI